jgi:Domain of unknown function (DUF1707)
VVVVGAVVMARPGGETAAGTAGPGRLRASHADREQVVDTLKAAFVQGMLAKDQFDVRVGQTFASRTHGELVAVTAGLLIAGAQMLDSRYEKKKKRSRGQQLPRPASSSGGY